MGWSLYYLVHGIVLDAVFCCVQRQWPTLYTSAPSTCLASLRFAGLSLPLLCWAELSCTVTVSCPHGRKFLLLLASTAAAAIRSWFESRKRKAVCIVRGRCLLGARPPSSPPCRPLTYVSCLSSNKTPPIIVFFVAQVFFGLHFYSSVFSLAFFIPVSLSHSRILYVPVAVPPSHPSRPLVSLDRHPDNFVVDLSLFPPA